MHHQQISLCSLHKRLNKSLTCCRKFRTKASLVVFSQSPSIHQSLHEVIYISRGRAVWAPCSASGYPKPFITWTTPRGRTFSPGAYGAG